MSRLGLTPPALLDVDAECDRYERWLRDHLTRHSVDILEIPEARHETLLEWDLEVRKPFKEDGSGYRDALIWCTVLDACRLREVFLVSNDRGFAQNRRSPQVLAEGLRRDLIEQGGAAESVLLFPKTSELIEYLSGREVDVVDALNAAFGAGTPLRDALVSDLTDKLLQTDTARVGVQGVGGDVVELIQEQIHEPILLRVEGATRVDHDEYLIEVYVEADVDLAVTWRDERWQDSDLYDTDTHWRRSEPSYESAGATATLYYSAEALYQRAAACFTDVNVATHAGGRVNVRW